LAQVVPHAEALRGAEALLKVGEKLGALRLVAAAGPEDGAEQRAERDPVVARVRCDRAALLLEVGVDAGDVRVDVLDQLPPARRLLRELHLRGEERLRLRAGNEPARGQRERERVVPRNVERRAARRATERLERESTN